APAREAAARAPSTAAASPPAAPSTGPVIATAVPAATPQPTGFTPSGAAVPPGPGWRVARVSRFAAVRRASIPQTTTRLPAPAPAGLGRAVARPPWSAPAGLGGTVSPPHGGSSAASGGYAAQSAMSRGLARAVDPRSVGGGQAGASALVHRRPHYPVSVLRRMVGRATAVNPALRLGRARSPPIGVPARPGEAPAAG